MYTGRGLALLSKVSSSFCLCYLKKLSAGSDKQEMVPSPTGCSLRREQSMAGPAAHGIYAPAP